MSEIYTKSLTIGDTIIKGLPPVSIADNEKVLGVVNGQWAVVDPESFEVTEKSWTKTLSFGGKDNFSPLPITSIADNNKVLTVVNGEWAVVLCDTALF